MAVKGDLVLVLTIESVVIGVVLGFMIRPFNPSNDAINLIGFPGEIFMQIVEMMILPLIISSVISALAQIRPNDAGRIGGLTVLYYVMTTFLSTFTGIILVSSIHPGDPTLRDSLREGTLDDTALSTLDTFLDQIRNMFPENIIQATFQQVQTNYIPVKARVRSLLLTNVTSFAASNMSSATASNVIMKPILEYTNEVNVLGLIVFCTGFGVILSILGEQARLMINFFIVLDAVIMKWISALMWCYPIGILSLVCKNILDIDNLTETAQALAMYVVTVICGLMIHSLLTLPLLFYLFTRRSPFNFMTGMMQAIATAFGTASSGASLPVTFRSLEGNLKIDRRVTRFVLPLGATITMDGTALYESVAVIFIAQLHNVQLSILELLTISITTTVASIGSGSVPAGLDTILIVLTTVGLPAKDLSLLLTVDCDRIRTSVNVLGDGFGCGIIYHLTKRRLIESDEDELIQQLRSDIELLNANIMPHASDSHVTAVKTTRECADEVVLTGTSEPMLSPLQQKQHQLYKKQQQDEQKQLQKQQQEEQQRLYDQQQQYSQQRQLYEQQQYVNNDAISKQHEQHQCYGNLSQQQFSPQLNEQQVRFTTQQTQQQLDSYARCHCKSSEPLHMVESQEFDISRSMVALAPPRNNNNLLALPVPLTPRSNRSVRRLSVASSVLSDSSRRRPSQSSQSQADERRSLLEGSVEFMV